jgi:hypothetical protein
MACDPRRTYLPIPITTVSPCTPPTDPNDFAGMQRFLQCVIDNLGGNGNTRPVPGPVSNFVATAQTGGIAVTWDVGAHMPYFMLYRAGSNDFRFANVVGTPHSEKTVGMLFFDKYGQNQSQRFYWIQALNLSLVAGPLTGPVIATDPEAT